MSARGLLLSVCLTAGFLLQSPVHAELAELGDDAMARVSGQGGIYLSGDISINALGGPIENSYFGRCDDRQKTCGARVAYRLRENGGWMVLDEIQGNFAFEGLTLRVRWIDSGFGGDGEPFNGEVLELGLPDTIRFSDVRFRMAASSTARPTDPGFRQTDIFTVDMQGEVLMRGNLLIFPSGAP